MTNDDHINELVDKAVAEGGAYDIIRQRLIEQGDALEARTAALNTARAEEFGSTDIAVVARARVRTENNCLGRDIVQVGDFLLFGYNVFIGLKKSTQVDDVFSLYRLVVEGDKHTMEPVPSAGSFLQGEKFRADFDELYRYYKETRLVQLVHKGGKLLAAFQIGDRLDDLRVFRWDVASDGGEITYVDNRGERDIELPLPYDFEWIATAREDVVHGRFPHVNILDQVFVETINGDLTVKIENNTEDGRGIYREPVDDATQSLDDAEIHYAAVGTLILIKVLPYKEVQWRCLVYNTLTAEISRIDEIIDSCVQLPEDHGIIFPGGYYLDSGEYKNFGTDVSGLLFKRKIRSPNGEDMLYSFYEPVSGTVVLLSYNLITKSLQNPIVGHGYALARDGTIVVFTAGDESTRIHPMQIWSTPYVTEEFASAAPTTHTFFSRIGNSEMVRGVSDLYSVIKLIKSSTVSALHFETLRKSIEKLTDNHFWITDEATDGIGDLVREATSTVELIVDEFEKVENIRRQSALAMQEADAEQQRLFATSRDSEQSSIDEYVAVLDRVRKQRGHLATIREYRYIDTDRLAEMDEALVELNIQLGEKTASFLARDGALDTYLQSIDALASKITERDTVAALAPDLDELEVIAGGLDLLSELIATLKVDDATIRTRIVESISEVYTRLNQTRARARQHGDNLGSEEAVEQFAAQFKLLSQSTTNALGLATSPERCDEQLTRLLVQVEELEGQFSEHERFLSDIMEKRESIYDTFEAHKQQLLDARQARAHTLVDSVGRMLSNIEKRTRRFDTADELNTYLAADALVLKVRDIVVQLRDLDSAVKADDAESRLKMIRDQALRSLRDKTDLYVDGGKVIKLGNQHRFSVNTEDLDLTILPRESGLALHLIGTQFYEPIDHPELSALKDYWNLTIESETETVYRGEYLAYRIIEAARSGTDELSWDVLTQAVADSATVNKLVREFATPRYRDGYQKGVHDADAANILMALVPVITRGKLLRFDPVSRALAQLVWASLQSNAKPDTGTSVQATLIARAKSANRLQSLLGDSQAVSLIEQELREQFDELLELHPIAIEESVIDRAVAYLAAELGRDSLGFVGSGQAQTLHELFTKSLQATDRQDFLNALNKLDGFPAKQWSLAHTWLQALINANAAHELQHYLSETAVQLIVASKLPRRSLKVDIEVRVTELFGEHPTIDQGTLTLTLDTFLSRLASHCDDTVPAYRKYLALRHEIAVDARESLRLDEFKPRPLSSFVRNRLINEAYLPILGDNLAKQIGTVGESKRSDLNGLLLMISPPGYGKTTLMEYVASRLGLTFMKINCPSLGHDVASLDPAIAPNATARQELEKLNLALEMGDNVMLYLDDIQHTHPEFLQKFISLCDSTRRIEGVWKGRTRTYDLRGRKFCVVMAGNPYTESGETFKVPDMLANRADIYNLGDVLSGKEAQFALSYIENCLTSNPILAPLATRDLADVHKLIERARGREVATTDLSHSYSGAEIAEITRVLERLFTVQDTVLKVNQQYIASAAQEDKFRVEPRFQLQGSYRNMNKLAEKISAVMNDDELEELINDHYRGEAQLLTQGAEANQLKLREIRGTLDDESAARWQQIKQDFLREKSLGGDGADGATRISSQLADLVDGVKVLGTVVQPNGAIDAAREHHAKTVKLIGESLGQLSDAVKEQKTAISITNTPSEEFAEVLRTLNDTIEHTLFPLVRSMDNRIAQDIDAHTQLKRLSEDVSALKRQSGV